MLAFQSLSGCSARPVNSIFRINSSVLRIVCNACSSSNSFLGLTSSHGGCKLSGQPSGYSGVRIEETVSVESGKHRLDTWISSRIDGISRARVQASIRSGLVFVNGSVVNKVSYLVRHGDKVSCTVAELQPLRAEPEDIPLDIVHEDEHVLVVNKPAHMVVHPAPGNASGTLVNGILGHCQLPTPYFSPDPEIDGDSSDEITAESIHRIRDGSINFGLSEDVRPGIVHRLDKGTSGLLVIAKDEYSHSHLAKQFKEHTIKRVYVSITCGVPSSDSGLVEVPVGRDPNNRIRMAAIPGSVANGKSRRAVSSRSMSSMINSKASSHSNSLVQIADCCEPNKSKVHNPYTLCGLTNEEPVTSVGHHSRLESGFVHNSEVNSRVGAQLSIYFDLLHRLSNSNASLCQIRQTHAILLRTGLLDICKCSNKLLSLYASQKHFSDAKSLLRSILHPDSHAFTTLITSFSKASDSESTIILFSEMLRIGLFPDAHVLPSVIRACAGMLVFEIGKQAHGFSVASGLFLDPFVESSLVHFYVRIGELSDAKKLFCNMVEKDVVSWSALAAAYARKGDIINAKGVFDAVECLGFEPNIVSWNGMIAGFNQSGCFQDAISMFQQMHSRGFPSDGTNISSVLPAIGNLGYLNLGTQIHGHVIKGGFAGDKCIVSALIYMYGKCGNASAMLLVFEDMDRIDVGVCNALIAGLAQHGLFDKALSTFEQLRHLGMENVVSWTSVIAGCSQHGRDIEALRLFREMQASGVKPNSVTIPCLLPACGNIAALMYGKAVHCFSLRSYLSDDVYVGSALIDMYANCGKLQAARCFFERMSVRNLVCWNALLGAYSMHGKAKEAIEIFIRMQRCGEKPDSVSYTSLLSACSQGGLIDEGYQYFECMSRDHGIQPRLEHYACIVSLHGRAGKLEEACSMIKNMPFEPDACVWGALLSSCALHMNMHLGEIAAAKLFELEPMNPGNYILLSNIYASKRKWKEVNRVRDMMNAKGMRKNPGCSWIEIKNKLYMVLAGDKSLPGLPQILEKLTIFNQEMKKAGYAPNTDHVLQDVEEQEEKEYILCGHSEKLAVVFGILNTSQGSPLRVTKNLRICGDCHAVIKFISGFEHREISVRDANRYHHFKEGVCTCGDYW